MDNFLRHHLGMQKQSLREVVAAHVKQAMADNHLIDTQQKLAKKAKIGQSHVSRLLRAENVTLDVVEKVAHALQREPFELLLSDDHARLTIMRRVFAEHLPAPSVANPFPHLPLPNPKKATPR